jgi:cytochrome P450
MLANPYPFYHRLRATQPVLRVPALDVWIVTTYEGVNGCLRNPRLSSDRFPRARARLESKGLAGMIDDRMKSMIHMDAPDHTRLRSLVNKAFTPKAVDAMEGRIDQIIEELLDAAIQKGSFDLIADLAYPLPVMVIAEMLGVPAEDRAKFKLWSNELSAILAGDPAALPDGILGRVMAARLELVDYFRAIAAVRRVTPGNDLLSALVQAEEEGGRLSEDELYSTLVLLLVAGNETTTNLIGNGMLALLSHGDELRRLSGDPTLVSSAVEEMLRYDGPIQFTTRLAKADLEIHDTKIREGEWLYLVIGAANRDPSQFPDPDRFDVGRAGNKHIAFGAGAHFCLGAPLARLEAQRALHSLSRRCPNLHLSGEKPEYRNNFNLRGLKALQVEI